MRNIFYIFIFFLFVNITYGQTDIVLGPCGSDALNQERINTDPQYKQEMADFEKLVTEKRTNKINGKLSSNMRIASFDGIYRIPVVVHVVHRGEPIGEGINISDDHIREILKQSNQDYRKLVNTTGFGNGFDTNVEFALAVRDPNGNLTNGIERIDMSGNASYMALGLNAAFDETFDALAKYNLYPKDRYMNIYIVSGSDGGNWVAFGGGGIVCVSAYVFNLHGVVTHELGHEMSLAHTFAGETQNPDKTFNCPPPESDPYTEGDMCPDTPRHTEFSQTCGATVQNPCYPGDPTQVDDLYERNYMAYGRCGGGNGGMFSNDQRTRIRAKAEYKQKYYQYNQLVPPVLPNVDFFADNTVSTDVNIPLSFFEKSAGIPNTYMPESEWPNIQFAWIFKNGSTIYTSSKQNPVMTFSVPGYYDVTLTITTPLGTSTSTKQQYIFVQSQTITPVCSIDLVEGAYYHSLHVVKFNTIYKETRIDFSDVYLDLKATNNTIVNAGQTYPLTINVRGQIGVFQNVKAYIDYNDNGSFEDTELIFKGLSTSDFQYFTTNVTIPLSAIRNKLLTMRVIGYSGNSTNNCGRIGDPDVEDYGVVIGGDCTSDLIEFSANNTIGYAGSAIQFHDNSCVSDRSFVNNITYNWTFSNGAVTYSSNEQHPIVTFLQLGVYDVTLTITTPSGTQTLNKQNFLKITEAAKPVCATFTGEVNYWLYRSISKVVFNTINKETSTRTNEVYKDFRSTDYTVVKEGLIYPLSLNIRTSGGDMARYKVYIDYNDSGTFEDSELVVTGTSTASSIVTLSQNITIPFASIKNRMLTMRVMTSVGDISSACSNVSIPDVEDYGVMILGNCNTETIDFYSDKIMGCSNTTIKFIDKSCIPFSTNFNKYTYEWIFSSGEKRYTSSEQYPSITFIQTGVYNVTLNINTSSGIKTITKENYIKIAAPPIVLCTNITSKEDVLYSRNVNRVIFNTIDKKTSTSINEGYQDFRCTDYTLVKAGQTYPLTISINSTSTYNLERFKVYIDYNNDAIFSNSELIFEGKAIAAYTETYTKNIIIPSNFVKNTLLTMRVIGNSEDINSTCGSFKNADIEDYGIMIENDSASETIDFESNETIGFVNKNIKFIDKSIFPHTTNFNSDSHTYQWTFANALTTYTSTDQDPLIPFDEVGVYTATLIINTPSGIKTLIKENYIKIVELPLVVCNTITSSNNGYSNRNINRVNFNTIDKKTSTSINEGYQDYRFTDVTKVVAEQTYPLSITTSSSQYTLENFKVYIDYNNDASFATSELVFEGVATTNSSVQTFSKDVIIPVNAVKNTFLTMRVIGDGRSITSTCGAFENPDIEDYSVYIDDNCALEVIDFAPDIFIGCVNSTIKFFDNSCIPYSTNFSNYTYEWIVSNGTNTYNSNSQYPSITFAQTGLYTVTLNITTPLGVKTLIKENYIRITETPLAVCVISPSSGTWWNRAISKVVFNTISKVTPTNINEVYKDFRTTENTIVKEGFTYPLSINIGTTNGDKARYKVYIDYNYTGTFEETEVVFSGIFSGLSNAYASGVVSKEISIPNNGVKNKLLTMRVMTAVSDINTACSVISVPDVEDYGIIIIGYTAPPLANVSQTLCVGKTIADLVATGTSIKWYANDLWGTALVSSTVLTSGTYYVSQTLNDSESSRLAVSVIVSPRTIPTFTQVGAICSGGSLSALPTTSTNSITGTWSPELNNMATTEYTFTPTIGDCVTTAKLIITVNATLTTPTFSSVADVCSGASMNALPTTSINGIIGIWSPELNNIATTEYTFTPTVGQCATIAKLIITVIPNVTPTFTQVGAICSERILSALPTNSINGINGTWSPELNNSATTEYTFTPTVGQCATTAKLIITIIPNVTPTFTQVGAICSGRILSALPTNSINGIIGTWSPELNNTATTEYSFTPTTGQCATTAKLIITINPNVIPTFAVVAAICSGASMNALPTTSSNGIIGTWSPELNNTATTEYTFTPTVGQCATTAKLIITVNPNVIPTFSAVAAICSGASISDLPTTSKNGIIGTWSPELNNMATTEYTFTPTIGECVTTAKLIITVNATLTTPEFYSVADVCLGASMNALPTTSTNGIIGTWSPELNNTATTEYTFTPTVGQCATTAKLIITVNPNVTPTFSAVAAICSGGSLSALPETSTNSITGTWSPELNNMATTEYTFTPTIGDCVTTAKLIITVNATLTTPTFSAVADVCSGASMNALPTTSINGIIGIWSPELNNIATTEYTFTPTVGQCATIAKLIITINPNVIPTFAAVVAICSGGNLSALPTTSINGITGTWSPELNNTATTEYSFTPTTGQCATTAKLIITINPNVIPTFAAVAAICSGGSLSALTTTSTNSITGTWSPELNNIATTEYTFTPTIGECATKAKLIITVNATLTTPIFSAVADVCSGANMNALPTTSSNGIIGTWSPELNNSATTEYTFTPTVGQCATTAKLIITINPNVMPTFAAVAAICSGGNLSTLPMTSTNSITGTWSPELNNIATTEYTFTPTIGECATKAKLIITVNATLTTPTFSAVADVCSGASMNALPTTSSNGIIGTWSPELNNTATTEYTFTPTIDQCATSAKLTITINVVAIPIGVSPQILTVANASSATIADLVVSPTNVLWYTSLSDATLGVNVLGSTTVLTTGATYYVVSVAGDCSSSPLAISTTIALITADFDASNLNFYPNPTSGIVIIKYSKKIVEVSVVNLLGQVVLNKKTNATEVEIDLSSFPIATYLFNVVSDGKTQIIKVIKDK